MMHKVKLAGGMPDFFSSQVLEANRFYLDTYGHGARPFVVVCGGCEHCGPDYQIDRTDFPFHSLEFVARGKGTLTIKHQTVSLSSGTVFTYGPGVAHRIVADAGSPLVKYFVDFTGRQAHRLLRAHGLASGTVVQAASPDVILRLFDDLISDGVGSGRYRPLICASLVELMVLRIAETGTTEAPFHTRAFTTYQTCREFIRGNCLELRTLDEIAEACHVDKAYLCRLFQRFDSQSPYQYLLQLKMAEAARRLQRDEGLVKKVGYDLGFEDPFHFCRAFKKVFGLSPIAFKRLRQPLPTGQRPKAPAGPRP
jgi:AraC-like DNA-binding protein